MTDEAAIAALAKAMHRGMSMAEYGTLGDRPDLWLASAGIALEAMRADPAARAAIHAATAPEPGTAWEGYVEERAATAPEPTYSDVVRAEGPVYYSGDDPRFAATAPKRHDERTCPDCSRVIEEMGGNYLPHGNTDVDALSASPAQTPPEGTADIEGVHRDDWLTEAGS